MPTRRIRLIIVALALGVLLVAAGCGDDDDVEAGSASASGSASEPAAETTAAAAADFSLVSDGTLTMCTDAPYEPFEFEGDDGEFDGFDVEVIEGVATGLGLDTSWIVVPFDGIWLKPAAGDCDVVASAMTITEERAQAATFTDPYFDADQSLLVRAEDAEALASLADLEGKNIGVQTGTTGEMYAQENNPGATLVSFDEPAAMFLALASGDIDAILQDLPVNGFRATQDDGVVVTDTFPTGEQYGFAVSQDNAGLADAINGQLTALRDSGEYDTIFAKWFGSTS
jgi:polar amino acid transport system substrate-binding protein